jgi:hypothetical protein
MRIKTTVLNSICRFAAVMVVLCILPTGAFASENKPVFAPGENITKENFATIQKEMLNSINEQITDLKGFYSNVSEASNASELQKVLANQRCSDMPHGMNMGSGKMSGLFDISKVENVTDDNYTDVQEEIVSNIGNMTEMLNGQLNNTTDENMTTMLNEKITNLENFSSKISSASSAEELKNVVFTQMQTQATDSIEMEIEHIEKMENETESTTNENMSENLSSRITELKNILEDVKGADSLADLNKIMSSSHIMFGMGPGMGDGDMMHHGGNCPMGPGSMPKNNAENSTEA